MYQIKAANKTAAVELALREKTWSAKERTVLEKLKQFIAEEERRWSIMVTEEWLRDPVDFGTMPIGVAMRKGPNGEAIYLHAGKKFIIHEIADGVYTVGVCE